MRKNIFIHIGEYYASKEPAVIKTVLGSCVAVCLFDSKTRIGGMNHILLQGEAGLREQNNPARYSTDATKLLINAMLTLGADRQSIEAKVFGGANVLPGISGNFAMGPKISEFVLSFLKKEGIRIISSDLGGDMTRKIYLNTESGEVVLIRSQSIKSSCTHSQESQESMNDIL